MTSIVEKFLEVLDISAVDGVADTFQGENTHKSWKRIFGGQVIGQSLVAAQRTVDPKFIVHSLHGYFMRPGDPTTEVTFEVDRIRDGRSFATRRVVASQNGQAIFSLGSSFHIQENGFEHQFDMPEAPMPEDVPSEAELAERFAKKVPKSVVRSWINERPAEIRYVDADAYFNKDKTSFTNRVWFKLKGEVKGDLAMHQSILAYLSDYTLLTVATMPHEVGFYNNSNLMAASLDHSIWFHRPFKADEWLLYYMDTPSASGALGLARGSIYDRKGRLIASVAQEGLIRPIDSDKKKEA